MVDKYLVCVSMAESKRALLIPKQQFHYGHVHMWAHHTIYSEFLHRLKLNLSNVMIGI